MASTVDAAPTEESIAAEPTTLEKLRGLRWSIAANVANTIFVQYTFFGSVFVLFLDALGLNKSQIGFLLSLLPFAGLISLFIAPAVARFGYKRTYLTFWTARSVVAAFLLLTPWIVLTYGEEFTLVFISVIVAAFAILRAVGMTANMPWVQEFVPDAMRGKYTATSNMFTSMAGFVAISAGGFVLSRVTGLPGFIALISVGVLAGFVSVAFQSFVPGGAPVPKSSDQRRDVGAALRDVNFRRYLFVVALLVLGTVPLNSFVPLYMREEIGLQAGSVVFLQVGTLTGSVLSSYAWGWAADRFGSRPVVLWGLVLRAITPILWMLMPREAPLSLYVALGIAFIRGVSDMGWGIGSARLLYVSIVPPEKRSDYLALYNGWIGVAGGLAQLLGGRIVDVAQSLGGDIFFLALSPYTPLFISGFVLTGAALTLMGRIHADERVGMGEFVGIFFRGNPFLAMTSMIRFHLASSEPATVQLTERLGQAKSRLAVEELLEALVDPRFNVRFEAVVSIARMPAEPRLTQALIEVLNGSEVALSTIAAWALGRMGDPAAYDALIQGLDADFRSIQVHCARALGALGRREAIPILLERLRGEENVGLQMAFASALGNLQAEEATEDILTLLERMENEGARLELALSLARIAGDEGVFVNLARSARTDAGTAFAQAVLELRGLLRDVQLTDGSSLSERLDAMAQRLAQGDVDTGVRALADLLPLFPRARFSPCAQTILDACAWNLAVHGAARQEYAILALDVLRKPLPG